MSLHTQRLRDDLNEITILSLQTSVLFNFFVTYMTEIVDSAYGHFLSFRTHICSLLLERAILLKRRNISILRYTSCEVIESLTY